MTTTILILLIAFQIKHLIADYYLQFPYMYENKGQKTGWFYPLMEHAGMHMAGTMIILIAYSVYKDSQAIFITSMMLSLFDFITHFITDRWKATRGRKPDEKKFWTDLGIDQMVHHVVGIIIVYVITL